MGSRLLLVAISAGLTAGRQDGEPSAERPLAKVGDRVAEHEFPRLDWHDGRTRIEQLFGHPVLVGGWKQYIPEPSGLHVAAFANWLLDDFADDGLVVILEDRNPWDEKRWWRARSFWIRYYQHPVWFAAGEPGTIEDLPILRETSGLDERSAVLIGVDGTLVFEGTVEDGGEGPVGDRIRSAIERELERRKHGWGEDPHLKRARALAFGAGKFAAGLDSAAKSKASQDEVDQVRHEIETVVNSELVSVRYLLANGRVLEAEGRWKALSRGCRGHDELLATASELAAGFSGKEAKQAHQLGRRLAKLLEPMEHEEWRDFDADAVLALRAFAAKNADHPVGRRAARLDPLVKDLAGISRGRKALDAAIERHERKNARR